MAVSCTAEVVQYVGSQRTGKQYAEVSGMKSRQQACAGMALVSLSLLPLAATAAIAMHVLESILGS